MPKLTDFKLETFFSKWEFKARYHLCASDAESMTVNELMRITGTPIEKLLNVHMGYTETKGNPELLDLISSTYNQIKTNEIICFSGAEEGIFCAMNAILEPEDHAIVITPNYQSLEEIPASICSVSAVSLDSENNWDLDPDDIRNAVRENTRLIVINFPHNPTGKIIPAATLSELIQIASSQGIYIFSDEVYRLIERDPGKRLPQIADIYDRGISLSVMSKSYGLPGLRIGWIATKNTGLIVKMEKIKHYLSICNSAPSEFLAIAALQNREIFLERVRSITRGNLNLLNTFFDKHSDLFEWNEPDGGCTGFPKYIGPEGTETFTSDLLEKKSVLLLPPSLYHSKAAGRSYEGFRIGYGRKNMSEALVELENYLNENK